MASQSEINPIRMSETSQENPSAMSEVLKENVPAVSENANNVPTTVTKPSETLQESATAVTSAGSQEASSAVTDQTSQENQASCSETSKENSEYSFNIQISDVALDAILEVLTVMDHRMFGRIDVHEKGFDITVCRPHIMCYVVFEATHFSKFQFRSSLEYKMINLRSILHKLYDIDDDEADDTRFDNIAMHHVVGSNHLSFVFGDDSTRKEEFSVEIYQGDPIYKRCPNHSFICEVVLLAEDLRDMIPLMVKKEKPQKVNVLVMDDNLVFQIGNIQWTHNYNQEACGTERLKPRQTVTSEFWFPYTNALMSATFLAHTCLFCIVNDQHNTAVFKFNIEGLGHLAFVTLNTQEEPRTGLQKGITTFLRPRKLGKSYTDYPSEPIAT